MFEQKARDYGLELNCSPAMEVPDARMKLHLIAALYTDALRTIESDLVLFVEDDMVPASDSANRIVEEFRKLPDTAASLLAIYRSRFRPAAICAGQWYGDYLPWPGESEQGVVEIG